MKISGLLQRHRLLSGIFIAAVSGTLQAAPLNITTPFPDPDIVTNGTGVSYIYDGDGVNTLTITGTTNAANPGGLASTQFISIPGGNSKDGGFNAAISGQEAGPSNSVTRSGYTLEANFDNSGTFLGGNVQVDGYVVNTAGFFGTEAEAFFAGTHSGMVLSMDLLEFGFSGTPTTAGDRDTVIFEWEANITGGDLNLLGFAGFGGVVAVGNVFWGTTDPLSVAGGSYGALWDPLEVNDMSAFTSSFVSCTTGCPLQLDTFVPVPAAVWLFGSGLFGLIGAGMRRKPKS